MENNTMIVRIRIALVVFNVLVGSAVGTYLANLGQDPLPADMPQWQVVLSTLLFAPPAGASALMYLASALAMFVALAWNDWALARWTLRAEDAIARHGDGTTLTGELARLIVARFG